MTLDLTPYLSMRGSEVNCWTVVVRFYKGELGIDIPDFDEAVHGMISPDQFERVAELWVMERVEWVPVDEPKEFDVIDIWAFGSHHAAIHLGNGKMLHKIGTYTRTEDYRGSNWQRRIRGYYRHPSRA